MDDSSIMDIYEDLSLDKIYKMTTQTLPPNYTKPEPEDEESKIDLFMEALTVHTIDKVQSQLLELQKENHMLRCENAELKENKKQLSKNISSLFLTARQEIQKKEQEIAKLLLERPQENCESCRLKQVRHDSKHPVEKTSSVNRSTVCSKKEKPQSEIRNKLMQEISQSYSLSSCQGVASRKKPKGDAFDIQTVHKNSNKTILSEPEAWKTMVDELKSCEDRKVARSKQDTCMRSHHSTKYFSSTSDHQQPYVPTCGLTASKESLSLNLKNKRTISDVETQELVKIRKIETPKINLINKSTENIEKIMSTKLPEKRCSSRYEHPSHYESFDLNSSHSNTETAVTGNASKKPKHFMFVGTSEDDKDVSGASNRSTWSHFQGTFVSEETSKNHSAKCTLDGSSNGSMQHCLPHIHKDETLIKSVSSADKDVVGSETFVGKGSAKNDLQTNKHLKSDCSLASVVRTSLLGETSRRRNITSTSFLKNSFSAAISTNNQALLNGNDTAGNAHLTSCTQWKKKMAVGHDQNSNCSSNESPRSQGSPSDENGLNDSRDELLFSVENAEPTYITCTSNLILLGDEETTCTTMTSPYKLQPSEFYPPGMRGYVHEGGSHARHIRGITEVIKKVPIDKFHNFQSKPNTEFLPCGTADEKIQIKTSGGTSDESHSKNTCKSDGLNCHQTQESEIIDSVERKKSLSEKTEAYTFDKHLKLNSHICNNLEEIRNGKAEYTNNLQQSCDIQDGWAVAVNNLFGSIFHKELCALKQEPVHQFLKKPSSRGKTDSVTKEVISGVSKPLQTNLCKKGEEKK